eukprot:13258_1
MGKRTRKSKSKLIRSSKSDLIPPKIIRLPSESYIISITQQDKRKKNGGCKPKDPVWKNWNLILIDETQPPKNPNIRACVCKYCKHVVQKKKHPIKVSTLRSHGLKCAKTPDERKDIIRESINKLKVKDALFTLHKSKNNIIPSRTSFTHPLDIINPITYTNIITDIEMKLNEINHNNRVRGRDSLNINIENNSGRICVANISNSNNISDIGITLDNQEEPRETKTLLQKDLDRLIITNDENNQQEKPYQHQPDHQPLLAPTLAISTPSLADSMLPVLNLEIIPSLEERFPDSFPLIRQFDGNTTNNNSIHSIKQEKKEDDIPNRLNKFDIDYKKKYELQKQIDNEFFLFTIETLSCYNQWQKDRFCKIIQLIIDYALTSGGDTYKAPNGYSLRNGIMKQNLEFIHFKVDETIYENGRFAYYCDEGGPQRQGTFISVIRTQQTNFVVDLSVTGLNKKSTDLLELVKGICSPYIGGNCIMDLFLSDSTNKMVKLRRLVQELYYCDIMGGIEHVGQNIVDIMCNLPQFAWLFKEIKEVLNTMFNTGFIFILKEKLGLDTLDVLSKPWCSNATEWNKPYNMGSFLLKLKRGIGEAMIDERSKKYFNLETRQNYMVQSAHYHCISLTLSYYKPWKLCMMEASRKRVYLSDLLMMYTHCVAAVDYTLIDRAGGEFVVYANMGNGKEEKDEGMEYEECRYNKDDVAALFVRLYGIAKKKYVSNQNEISYGIIDPDGNEIQVNAEYHTPIADKIKTYFIGRWTKHIYIGKIAIAFFLDIVLREKQIMDKDKYFAEACTLLNKMISAKIGGNHYVAITNKLIDIQTSKGVYGRGVFDISHLSQDELISFDRALPWRQQYIMNDNDIIGKEVACIGVATFNLKPCNVDIERLMKGFNYVTRDLQLHKSIKLKFNEIYIRQNLKSLQSLGKI